MEHDQAIISHFYQNSKNVEVLERTEFEICTSVVSYCTTEQYAQVTALKQVTAPDEEEEGDTEKVNEQEGAEGNPEL